MSLTGYKQFLNRRKWEAGLTTSYVAPSVPDTNLFGTHSFDMEIYLERNATVEIYLDPNGSQAMTPSFLLNYNWTGAPQRYRFNVTDLTEDDYNFRAIIGGSESGFKYLGGSFEPNLEESGVGPYFEPVMDLASCPIDSGLTALGVPTFSVQFSPAHISLQWTTASGTTAYQIDRGIDGIIWTSLALTDANTTSILDRDFIPGPTAIYYYRIKAVGNSTNILDSGFTQSSVSATSKVLDTPVIATSLVTNNSVTLVWSQIANASYYEISRSSTLSGTYSSLGTASNSYQDTGLSASTVYHYKLTANGDGVIFLSSESAPLSVRTLG